MEKTYVIPEENLAGLEKRLDKLSRVARKLNLGGIVLDVVAHGRIERKDKHGETIAIPTVTIRVSGETPVINGWRFVATIDHDGETNIIRSLPGYEDGVPTTFRHTGKVCEHCMTYRNRRDTYIIKNDETGEFRQVGSSCLADFTGHADPHTLAAWAENLAEAVELCESEEDFDSFLGGGGKYLFPTSRVIGVAMRIIKEDGGYKSRVSSLSGVGTVDHVNDALDNAHLTEEEENRVKEVVNFVKEYFQTHEPRSDFEGNMSAIAEREYISYRNHGFACYLPVFAERLIEEQRRAELSPSKHVGNVGDKIKITGEVFSARVTDGVYGSTYIYTIVDQDGNNYVWFSSRNVLDQGDKVSGTATVKSHGEYKGVKQTVITRGKFTT